MSDYRSAQMLICSVPEEDRDTKYVNHDVDDVGMVCAIESDLFLYVED